MGAKRNRKLKKRLRKRERVKREIALGNREAKKKERKHYRDHHHLKARSRGGKRSPRNLLYLWREKHDAYHTLFGNATIPEAIELLKRVERAKRHQQEEP